MKKIDNLNTIVRKYIGKNEKNCALIIKLILAEININIDESVDDIQKSYSEIALILKKFAEEIHEEPKEGDIIVIVNPNRKEDEPEVHFGIFVDNYKRFFHLHKGNGIISNLSNIKRTFYLYKLKR